jgi:hypothetical protein
MAVRDIEAFLKERAARFDPNLDLTSGSPFDIQVVQPLVRRLGTDPFSVDLSTFLDARIRQAFPDMAVDEGDALADLLIKPNTLLWDPIVREITRVKQNLSFQDPTALSLEEAEALGANLFAERRSGSYARGMGRVFFSQPQNISISPINYFSSKGGLRFFPTEAQTIKTDEMLVNPAPDGSYFFDINLIAESPGDDYNIGKGELTSIANVEAAVRVTNLRRFRQGEDADTAEQFIDRAKGELTERSLVTLRGISAQLTRAFPEVRRLNVVGFNDPEMQRDVVKGGGYGPIIVSGQLGMVGDDGENKAASRRFITTEEDFTSIIGPSSLLPKGFVLTVANGVDDSAAPVFQDFAVLAVRGSDTIDIEEQVLGIGFSDLLWSLRKAELTLSSIPGGILFPDGPQGTVAIADDEIHIGGTTDMYIRGTGFDENTIILDNVTDDDKELSGLQAQPAALPQLAVDGFLLADLVTGTDYSINSETFRLLDRAGRDGLTLQIVAGLTSTNLGVYRVVGVSQINGQPVELQVSPTPPAIDGTDYRWHLFDQVNIDLIDPKETRITAGGLVTTQNSDIVQASPSINFSGLGVAEGDTLRILQGPDAGDYRLLQNPIAPGFDKLQLDTALKNTSSSLSFTVFRANSAGPLELPLVRITRLELLDSSNQPLGTTIPYAKPVDIQSRAFQNPARGVKHALIDVELGIISLVFPRVGLTGRTLEITVLQADSSEVSTSVVFTGDTSAIAVADINAALGVLGYNTSAFEFIRSGGTAVAFRPTGVGLILTSGTSLSLLFGDDERRSTADIRSATVNALPDSPGAGVSGWDELSPPVDFVTGLDLVQVVDGNQVGFYRSPYSGPPSTTRLFPNTTGSGSGVDTRALIIRDVTVLHDESTRQFAPEDNVQLELGSRSLGSVRCYFLEPTSIEFDQNSFFYVDTDAGTLRFLPDPSLPAQLLPPLPSDNKSNDGSATDGGTVFTSLSQDFLQAGVETGDELVIDYVPITGTVSLADPVPGLAGKVLTFSINNGPNLVLAFIRDDISLAPTEVSRDGVVAQINAAVGLNIVSLTGSNELEFEADAKIIVRPGTASPLILGPVAGSTKDFDVEDVTNVSPHAAGSPYTIAAITATTLTVVSTAAFGPTAPFTGPTLSRQGFRVQRPGVQRITTTAMAAQQAEAGLYYFDVELVSEGVGDLWNISSKLQLFVDVFRSDGYYLTTDDPNLTFSTVERPKLVISKSILEEGVDDSPTNATQIVGQNIQVTYERSQLVANVQAFVTSETERVQCESALARHLIPHYVRFDLRYVGGSTEELVVRDTEQYIRDLFPEDALESSDLQKLVTDRGATSIDNPLNLIAVVHNVDRSRQVTRSQNSLTTGRLAAFIPDVLNIQRDILS